MSISSLPTGGYTADMGRPGGRGGRAGAEGSSLGGKVRLVIGGGASGGVAGVVFSSRISSTRQ